MSQGQDFFAEPKTVEIGGERYEVRVLPVKHLSKAFRLAAPIVSALSSGGGDVVAAIVENTDSVIELVALSTGREAKEIGELSPADLLTLATAIIEANSDFFSRRINPAMDDLLRVIQSKAGGPQPSPVSAESGIGPQT